MSESLNIRPATIEDAETIAEFNARMARETEGLALDRATLAAGVRAVFEKQTGARYFVAEAAGRIVGQLMLTDEWSDWRNGAIWWIQSVYVDADMRGQGVFRSLYRHVEALAREQGAVGLRLYVERENAAAQRTYARLGMSMTHYGLMERMF
jgi:GNAT superfamily N-acetyltransferase